MMCAGGAICRVDITQSGVGMVVSPWNVMYGSVVAQKGRVPTSPVDLASPTLILLPLALRDMVTLEALGSGMKRRVGYCAVCSYVKEPASVY